MASRTPSVEASFSVVVPGYSLISQIVAPVVIAAPGSAVRPVTVSALWALMGCSIFHGFEHDDHLTCFDGVAVADADLYDGALHRGRQRVTGRGRGGLPAARALRGGLLRATSAARAEAGGQ